MGTALLLFAAFCLLVQWSGVGLALVSMLRPRKTAAARPPVSVLRPVCGLENFLEETLETTFQADYPSFEIIFCVADPADPAIPLVQRLIARYPAVPARLLVGDDKVSGNPKLNNLVKGWKAARHDHILMSDSNVLLPPDYLTRLMAEFTPETGLASSPPIGIRPQGFAAHLECAYLNSHQAKVQMAAAALGQGYAQGKMLLWDRKVLEDAGGLAVLGREMAEDVASTKTVRAAGKVVRLPGRFFEQPIGPRKLSVVWNRQVRWAKVRRLGFAGLYWPEALAGAALPALAVAVAGPLWALPVYLALWYLAEYALAIAGNWPRSTADIAAWVLRDLSLPVLWLAGWRGNSFEWRGNAMTAKDVAK